MKTYDLERMISQNRVFLFSILPSVITDERKLTKNGILNRKNDYCSPCTKGYRNPPFNIRKFTPGITFSVGNKCSSLSSFLFFLQKQIPELLTKTKLAGRQHCLLIERNYCNQYLQKKNELAHTIQSCRKQDHYLSFLWTYLIVTVPATLFIKFR